ncbi:restriction endonuclease subunit S [Hymenobacter sp. BT175]|uniref:restriction endonuclease subunit S n=1 Tax=Hymenobacter translucens TaxID=2886507 RepID=UPI001D0EE8B6|nr:restriction endonuclease subunit S [Hymenobacter translucens]MCC2547431.1 restriction endonuclease subunit S [Hymenobacter translucens]
MQENQELPDSWAWTTIEDIGRVTSGGTPQSTDPNNFGTDIAWVTPADLSGYTEKYISEGARSLSTKGVNSCSATIIPAGSVLFSSRAPVGYVVIAANDISTNQGFKNITPTAELVNSEYVYYYLKASKRLAESYASGTTFLELSGKNFSRLPFPLAPLTEQRRIVAKLEELFSRLDAGVATLRQTQAQLKRYRQSVLHAAVTGELTRAWRAAHPEPTESGAALLERIREERRARWEAVQLAKRGGQLPLNDAWKQKYEQPAAPDTSELPELPEGWAWTTFEEISDRVTVGFVGSMKNEYIEEGIPFLRSQNVRENRYSSDGLKYVSQKFHDLISKSTLAPGDLAVVRSGSVGTTCVIPDTLPIANCSDLVIVKQPRILPEFCAYYMNSVAKGRVNAQKVGVALIHFNTQAMAIMPLPVPSLAEQAEIVAEAERRLSVLDNLELTLKAELTRAERLRQSIMHRAFTGRLVPQDATDEPAAELLARLQAETAAAPAKGKRGRKAKTADEQLSMEL